MDGWERGWPDGVPRKAVVREHEGKISVVLGMRRVGKTWLCFQKMRELEEDGISRRRMLYVNFEDERLLPFSAEHFQSLLDVYFRLCPEATESAYYLFLDEPQRIPGWELFLRRVLDEGRARLFVTGSSAKMLGREIATALRGRALSTELYPLRFGEYLRFHEVAWSGKKAYSTRDRAVLSDALSGYLACGGFPEVQGADNGAIQRDILRGYVDVVILRDVIERHKVANVAALRALIRQVFQSPGALFSVNKFYNQLRSMGVPCTKNTLYEFLNQLADAYLLYPVELRTRSAKQRQVNPRKVYVADTGLIQAYSMGMTGDHGAMLENAVFMELKSRGLSVDYVVTKSGFEVDFLAGEEQGVPELIQVCWSLDRPETADREFRAITEALDEGLAERGAVICFDSGNVKSPDPRVAVVSAFCWFLEGAGQIGEKGA